MLLEGAVSYLDTRGSSHDAHWACNGFTASTVPATGLRAVGVYSAYRRLVFLLIMPASPSTARRSIDTLCHRSTFDAGLPRSCAPGRPWPALNLAAWRH